ncbi:hypothetical protein [Sphingomonas sp.]|uniref:hypothetical protein n=1 Tax=Sphingomonas sp. TaxID=28214 RepID=UPI001EBAA7FA|nr:hypothetical protein [Sphingomonas sp.]MBX3594919.1 hypothetical protein [Sphingomonas sp.]
MNEARPDLSVALEAYLGYRVHPFPGNHWGAVVAALGLVRAQEIEVPMLGVLADLDAIEPDWRRQSLDQASEAAAREIRARYTDVDERAGEALFWAYGYGYK